MTKRRLSLEDVRRDPKLLARFIKQNPSETDRTRFEKALGAMCEPVKTPQSDDQT
jgi:hypothetical protein